MENYIENGIKYSKLFVHNCQARMVCGRLNGTASMMALGNSLATSIDGSKKGRGIVSVNGVMSNLQYYFEKPEWIEGWWNDRGLDNKGYDNSEIQEEEIILSGEEEINIVDEMVEYDFEGIHKEVNNAKKQEFDNI